MAKEKDSDITQELENRFLTYALSTIVSRSLPDVRDGLKPIHRRILYAMNGMGVSADSKAVKSAKIIGEVLGKFHPHGDTSTYDSMVRMAQDFAMRYPLVDGKGNFGSVDGDSPAAYRYTEGKLTPITSYMLADIKKNTVEFRANYDNTLQEPVILPSRVPNLLINGSSGIAVGMACSFPSHNLKEVMNALMSLIDDREQTTTQIMKHIKGPDFPTAGIVLNSKAELRKMYDEGSGNLRVRGKWMLETLARGKTQIVITEIPYGINKARLIEKIAEIIIAKKLQALTDIRDESDENMRVVLEMKAGSDAEKIMAYLCKHSDLESGFQINFNCLKPNGEPERLPIRDLCVHFLDFRKDVVTRRLQYDLDVLEKRLHILDGFAAIFSDLDKALKLIRSSKSKDEAAGKLKTAFKIDDEQTAAILDIPLYRLVSMEIDKILQEQKEKKKEQKRLQDILKSQKKIWGEVKGELKEIADKFSDKRRTQFGSDEAVEFNEEDFIEHEDVVLVISRNGWLRKMKTVTDPASLKFKENDSLLEMARVNTADLVAFFTSLGAVYVQKVHSLPYTRSGFGEPIQSLFKFGDGERVIKLLPLLSKESVKAQTAAGRGAQQSLALDGIGHDEGEELLLVNSAGYGFRFAVDNLGETTRSGKKVMTLKDDARLTAIVRVTGSHAFLLSDAGKGLLVKLDQITQLSGAGVGVRLINVGKNRFLAVKCVKARETVELVLEDGKTKDLKMSAVPEYNRGSQGVTVVKRGKVVRIH